MKSSVVLVGMGEMGGVFARGFLKAGYPVIPVLRGANLESVCSTSNELPSAVVVAVGEKDLPGFLKDVPVSVKDRLVLLQNELLPRDWEAYALENPTVISVWFEKKYPSDFKEIIPSPILGPLAGLVETALNTLGINCKPLDNADDLVCELIVKNLYILTSNIAGLKVGGTVGELWANHQDFARTVISDVLDIQFALAGRSFDREALIQKMVEAFDGDPDHKCRGRSAPARLERSLVLAREHGLNASALQAILLLQGIDKELS